MNGIRTAFLVVTAALCVASAASADDRLLGRVTIERSMMQSGGAELDELIIAPGRDDGANLIVDRGKADEMALSLSRWGRGIFSSHLGKLLEWGETAGREKIDTIKAVGTVSARPESGGGPAVIATRFISSRSGTSWLGQVRFCQLPKDEKQSVETIAVICDRDRSFYLRPAETARLLEILGEKVSVPAR